MARALLDAKHLQELTEFVALTDEYSKEKWTLIKSREGVWLKQSVMVKIGAASYNRQAHVLRSVSFDVPVLWFNFYYRVETDGRPLRRDELLQKVIALSRLGFDAELLQDIHPYYGVPFFYIDPTGTRKRVDSQASSEGNCIARWLSVYGCAIGIQLTEELLAVAGVEPQRPKLIGGTPRESKIITIAEEAEDLVVQTSRTTTGSTIDSLDSAQDSPLSASSG